jgi:hypothetical protein
MGRAIRRVVVVGLLGICASAAPALAQESSGVTPFADVAITHEKTSLWSDAEGPGLQFGLGAQTSPHGSWRFEANRPQHDFHVAGERSTFSVASGSVLFGYQPQPYGRLELGLLVGGGFDVLTHSTQTDLLPEIAFGVDAAVRLSRYVRIVPTLRVNQNLMGHTTVTSGLGVRFGQSPAGPERVRRADTPDTPRTEGLPAAELGGSFGGSGYGGRFLTHVTAQGTVNANKLWSFEGGLEKPTDQYFYPVFFVQGRRLVATLGGPSRRTRIYTTFGAGWMYESTAYAHYTYLHSGRGGVGVVHELANHLALRADLQGLFFGIGDGGASIALRPTIGLVVPIGHHHN